MVARRSRAVTRTSNAPARRRRRTRARGGVVSRGSKLTAEYFKSLVDPFEYKSIHVGWGCMVPTTIISAYGRVTSVSAADGSWAGILLPCSFDPLQIWNIGVGLASPSTTFNSANATNVTGEAAEGRVLSCGLRAFPAVPLTAAPGVSYTGALVPENFDDIQLLTITQLNQLPSSHQSIGLRGGSSTGRPIDPDSFVFTRQAVNALGYTGDTASQASEIPFSCPYVSFVGLPAATIIFVEFVINIEVTSNINPAGGAPVIPADSPATNTLADYWPSFENMWGKFVEHLPTPGRAGEALASIDATFIENVVEGTASIGNAFRSMSNMGALLYGNLPGDVYGRSGMPLPLQYMPNLS